MASSKCFPYRPHDYMYDPIFQVSGPVDHYKAAIVARMSTAKFQICPIFPNMFSDLPHYPRVQLVRRRVPPIMSYREKKEYIKNYDPALYKKPDVLGADRLKYFCPIVNFPPKDALPYQTFPTFTIEKIIKKKRNAYKAKIDVQTETKYRDSDAQTDPWEPPYVVIGKGDPEILKLDFLKWGSGLPAGMHEVRLIERARIKAVWEKVMKPNIADEKSLENYREYLETIERDEWAFREKEINEIQELRMHLLEKMIEEVMENSKSRSEAKLKNFIDIKETEKEKQLAKIRKQTARELRKLESQQLGLQKKYHEVNIIDEHVDMKSELYAPLMRHGEHPKRWHLVIDEKLKMYKPQFIGVEDYNTIPKWLDQATKIKRRELFSNADHTRLCIRETKWTAPVLKELYDELQNLRKVEEPKPLSLRTRVEIVESEAATPEVEGVPEEEEARYQAAVLLQKIVRGRATQMVIYEGRDNCKELIKELKYSVGLLKKQKETRSKEKLKVKIQQREESMQLNMVQKLKGILGKLQGSVVGSLLDFLNKELRRLLEERKAHAMCLINERERYLKEAAEAGRRQKEIRRRLEHDEMFKQIVKVTQETVDVYLQDIITEGTDFGSKEEATEYVLKLSRQIEEETDQIYAQKDSLAMDDQDEMIADMVLHFLVPEVEKKIIRQRLAAKQKENLKQIHNTIYTRFESLQKSKDEKHFESESQEMATDLTTDFSSGLIEQPKVESNKENKEKTEHIIDVKMSAYLENIDKSIIENEQQPFKEDFELYLAGLNQETESIEEMEMVDENVDEFDYTYLHEALETITEVSEKSSQK